jgi:heme/copper-type cytochrome/quinol oxidase subunit 2
MNAPIDQIASQLITNAPQSLRAYAEANLFADIIGVGILLVVFIFLGASLVLVARSRKWVDDKTPFDSDVILTVLLIVTAVMGFFLICIAPCVCGESYLIKKAPEVYALRLILNK